MAGIPSQSGGKPEIQLAKYEKLTSFSDPGRKKVESGGDLPSPNGAFRLQCGGV